MLHRIGAVGVVLLALACVSPEAWAGKVGPEFRVNTYTNDHQWQPSVAALKNDGFVVIWDSQGQDGSGFGIYGQRYTAAGTRVGGEFRVNTTTASDQYDSSVADLNDGGFVVTWSSFRGGPGRNDIYGQRYNAAGARVGGEFRANTHTQDRQQRPSVAALSDGGFVITWSSYGQDSFLVVGVHGQRYSAAGERVGSEFRVDTTGGDEPSVAALSDGGFVVTWISIDDSGPYPWGVYAQRYSAAGTRVGNGFHVNTRTAGAQVSQSIAGLNNGGFVVTWVSISHPQDGSGAGIYGQRYTAAGARVGGEFRVDTTGGGEPSVAALSGGGFVVTWTSTLFIYGQRYSSAGVRVGGEFQVNRTGGGQGPSVAALSNNGFVVNWHSWGLDGYTYDVFGQRFSP